MPKTVLVKAIADLDYLGTTYVPGQVFWATPRDVLILAHKKAISLTRPTRSPSPAAMPSIAKRRPPAKRRDP